VDRRDTVDERDQLGAVVPVAAGERPGERDPAPLDQEVMLGAGSRSINRARARRRAPLFACTWRASATARDHSISLAACKRASSNSCSRSHTPAFCHESRRRQQVTPEPKPSSAGRCVHEIPVSARTRSPATPADRAAASDPDSESAAASPAATGRPAPTTRPRQSTARRPSTPLTA
jgi:hypothetical protein